MFLCVCMCLSSADLFNFQKEFSLSFPIFCKTPDKLLLTIGGCDCSELTSCLYLLMLRDGSMRSWRSLKSLWYLLGNFSHESRSRDTAPWPRPDMMANMELKFLHSLHCPAHKHRYCSESHVRTQILFNYHENNTNQYLLATFINCLMILDLLTRLCSEQTSVTTQNISLFTNCNKKTEKFTIILADLTDVLYTLL